MWRHRGGGIEISAVAAKMLIIVAWHRRRKGVAWRNGGRRINMQCASAYRIGGVASAARSAWHQAWRWRHLGGISAAR
jgi:hypothetical protein